MKLKIVIAVLCDVELPDEDLRAKANRIVKHMPKEQNDG